MDILNPYPYLEEDIREVLAYVAWRSGEIEVPLTTDQGRETNNKCLPDSLLGGLNS